MPAAFRSGPGACRRRSRASRRWRRDGRNARRRARQRRRCRRRAVRDVGGAPRRRCRVGTGVLGRRRVHPARLPGRSNVDHPLGHRDRAAGSPYAGDASHVGHVDAGPVIRPVRARDRYERPAGDGGLAWRPLRPPGTADPRDHRDPPHDQHGTAAHLPGRGVHPSPARR